MVTIWMLKVFRFFYSMAFLLGKLGLENNFLIGALNSYTKYHICLFSRVLKCRSPLECIGFSMDFRRTQSSYIRNSFDLDRSQTLECNIKEKKRRIKFFSKVSSGFCTNGPSIIFSEYWHFENKKKQQFCRHCIYND